jgi:radical SAM superfamily enzyme
MLFFMSQLVNSASVTICLNAKHSGSIFGSVRQTQTVQYTCQGIPQREGCVCGDGCVFCRPVVVGWSELQVDVLVSRQRDDRKSDGCVSA